MIYFLGLDISTSSTGVCLIDETGSVVFMNYVSLKGSVYEKADQMKDFFSEMSKHISSGDHIKIYIEQNLQAFRSGLSSTKTLFALANFNGIVSYIVRNQFHIDPVYLNVNSARKIVGCKIDRKDKSRSTKEKVLSWVTLQNPDFEWPEKILKSGPRKGQTILEPGCFDIADAYVIAIAGFRSDA
jgi:hypothetical protein